MDQYRMIDGKDVIAFLSGFSAFIKKVTLYILTSIRDRFKVFIIAFVLVVAAGIGYWYTTKPYYEAEMALSYHALTKKAYGEMLHNLDMLAKDHSYDRLSGILHLPLAETKNIISIEGKNMVGSMLYEDITEEGQEHGPIYIDTKVADSSIFVSLQSALVNYLNTGSPLVVAKNQQDSVDINSKLQYFKSDIATIDSVILAYRALINIASESSIPENELAILIEHRNKISDQFLAFERKARTYKMLVEPVYNFTPLNHPSDERNKNLKLTIGAAIILACSSSVLSRMRHDINAAQKTLPVV